MPLLDPPTLLSGKLLLPLLLAIVALVPLHDDFRSPDETNLTGAYESCVKTANIVSSLADPDGQTSKIWLCRVL